MASVNSQEQLISGIIARLSQTPYACSTLTRIPSGTTNLVCRGKLIVPLEFPDNTTSANDDTIIVKHSVGHASGNQEIRLDLTRVVRDPKTEIQTPLLLAEYPTTSPDIHHNITPSLHVFADFGRSNILAEVPNDSIKDTGRALGGWLRGFHDQTYSSSTELLSLSRVVMTNEGMRELKRKISYEAVLSILEENFSNILEEGDNVRDTIQEAVDAGCRDLSVSCSDMQTTERTNSYGIIHGDLWTGNLLVSLGSQESAPPSKDINLTVLDFEFTQFSHFAVDLGQMLADLYEKGHFYLLPRALIRAMIKSFFEGYGEIDEELKRKTLIHAGVHMICWFIRRNPTAPIREPMERVESLMRTAVKWIQIGKSQNEDYELGAMGDTLYG
ncbi:hypothetical protein BU24DRAFT_468550 [Aaosphaeria arxii CBS 175.79]|uniref:Uncharacterized protein n=1 Tax=Aaosphaeria arxii CBS 175.79 TaxID=1450172 RepID=A0A6A5X750_9PLEO|nr:uncharacterized protein BU24DRAFT_468550 [Aaosphaeria arxii CBS 175.79]KAF2008759.1 hypothetical protein BU24DRAFT_468550 [Aaosphaeria arxii CBS 175.79]